MFMVHLIYFETNANGKKMAIGDNNFYEMLSDNDDDDINETDKI